MIIRTFLSLALLAAVAACATPFTANVARFQQLPAPTGESFTIESKDPTRAGSLEFAQYASYVENELTSQGYTKAASADAATMIVKLDYGVSEGREKVATRPSTFGGHYYGPYFSPYYGHGYYPYRYWRPSYAWGHYGGYYDPFWGPGWGYDEVYSYTVYRSYLDMDIVRTKSGEPVFEGRAETNSRSDDLTQLVPNLVEAMFTGFPGTSGETVRVKLDPKKKG